MPRERHGAPPKVYGQESPSWHSWTARVRTTQKPTSNPTHEQSPNGARKEKRDPLDPSIPHSSLC